MVKEKDFETPEFKKSVSQEIDGKMQNTDYFSTHFISALTKSAGMQNALKEEFDKCYKNKWITYKSDIAILSVKWIVGIGTGIILLYVGSLIGSNSSKTQQPTQKTEAQQVK